MSRKPRIEIDRTNRHQAAGAELLNSAKAVGPAHHLGEGIRDLLPGRAFIPRDPQARIVVKTAQQEGSGFQPGQAIAADSVPETPGSTPGFSAVARKPPVGRQQRTILERLNVTDAETDLF